MFEHAALLTAAAAPSRAHDTLGSAVTGRSRPAPPPPRPAARSSTDYAPDRARLADCTPDWARTAATPACPAAITPPPGVADCIPDWVRPAVAPAPPAAADFAPDWERLSSTPPWSD